MKRELRQFRWRLACLIRKVARWIDPTPHMIVMKFTREQQVRFRNEFKKRYKRNYVMARKLYGNVMEIK
jgi:hypothetical protein